MLFTTRDTIPDTQITVPPRYSNSKILKYLGYNNDGSQNTWGKISSWIPGDNLIANQVAQGQTEGTDSHDAIKADFGTRINKTLTDLAIAGTILTAGAAAPAVGAAGAGTAAAGTTAAGTAAGVTMATAASPAAAAASMVPAATAAQAASVGATAATAGTAATTASQAGNILKTIGGGGNTSDLIKKTVGMVGDDFDGSDKARAKSYYNSKSRTARYSINDYV